jgi:hypothetical protein
MENEAWNKEPRGSEYGYITRLSLPNGETHSRPFRYPSTGYVEAEAPGSDIAGYRLAACKKLGVAPPQPLLHGFLHGEGDYTAGIILYPRFSVQLIKVKLSEVVVTGQGECGAPRGWVKCSGSPELVLSALAGEGEYGERVARGLRRGLEVCTLHLITQAATDNILAAPSFGEMWARFGQYVKRFSSDQPTTLHEIANTVRAVGESTRGN